MSESFRYQDIMAEQRLGEFMDEYLYSRLLTQDGEPIQYKRMSDRESQLKGVDVCISAGDKSITIDEKASIYYSNAMIPTFAFELDSIQKGHIEPVDGWFINDELETQYYMLIWPNVKCGRKEGIWIRKDVSEIRKDDFTIVESMMIRKADIRLLLEKQGYNKSHLIEYAKRYRELCKGATTRKEQDILEGVKVMFSGQLAEKPINLVIRKEILWGLAKRVYLISQDGYASIKE